MNVAEPSARHGKTRLVFIERFFKHRRRTLFFPHKKKITHAHETACEITVARAAPFTPIPNLKMNTGSRTVFISAPISTVIIPVFALPCAVINAFIPSVSCTKTVPAA